MWPNKGGEPKPTRVLLGTKMNRHEWKRGKYVGIDPSKHGQNVVVYLMNHGFEAEFEDGTKWTVEPQWVDCFIKWGEYE